MHEPLRLRRFVGDMTRLIDVGNDEPGILDGAERLLRDLIAHDDWLPEAFAAPSAESYRQYLLHCDPLERFSVVSFVWLPGQRTPVHDHTVWGLVGVLRGAERCEEYAVPVSGRPMVQTGVHTVTVGEVDRVSPSLGDIHAVSNAGSAVAISIHVYGANIGATRRHTFDPQTGTSREFVSGYHNDLVPNLWARADRGGLP